MRFPLNVLIELKKNQWEGPVYVTLLNLQHVIYVRTFEGNDSEFLYILLFFFFRLGLVLLFKL